MQPNDFRYTLVIDGVEHILEKAPIGWESSVIKYNRDSTYFGMLRSFTVPLKFVKEGATLLRKEFYTSGIEGAAKIRIEELNRSTWQYENMYLGDIDFSNFRDGREDVEVNITEGGISKQIKAYENVKYEISTDVPEAVDILITGIRLRESGTFIFNAHTDDAKGDYFPGLTLVANDIKSNQISVRDVPGQQISDPLYRDSEQWFYTANVTGTVHLKGYIKGAVDSPYSGKQYKFLLVKSTNIILLNEHEVLSTLFDITPPQYGTVSFDVPFELDVEMNAGERLFFYEDSVGSLMSQSGVYLEEGEVSVSYDTISEPSHCKALRPKYVFDQLIKKMNGNVPYPTQSFFLKEWEQLCITSGDAIRQLPKAKIKTSFKDFFTSLNAVLNIGFGPEGNKVVLERKDYFFRPNLTAIKLGDIKDFGLEPYEPLISNSIKVGYPDQSYDELNGRDEFNSTQVYSTPVTRIQKELNLLSTYRADCYGIEFLRINLEGKNTTDSSSDNDVFMIKVRAQPETEGHYVPENSEDFTSVTGVQAGRTAYNLDLSPKRNLMRHGNYIHGMMDRLDGRYINFESAVKNAELVTIDQDGIKVVEKSNLNISALPAKLFLPYMFSFTTALPRNALQMISQFPTGCVKFMYRDREYSGFFIDVSVDVSRNSQQQLKLLVSPDNNLLNLIN